MILIGAVALLGGTLVYFMWPDVMVGVFHAPPLTWRQSVELALICGILLKSSSGSSSSK